MRDPRLYVKEIHSALESILIFTKDYSFDEFQNDDKTSSAVIRKFEIIGEAAKSVPDAIKTNYPSVPWKSLAGFRDVLIHNYFGIDEELVWTYIKQEVPNLTQEIERILKETFNE